jgi:hypothetical protein
MKMYPLCFAALMLLLAVTGSSAMTFYVDVNSPNPLPPYAGWSTASADIQSAIDAASDGDLILVTNGVYQTGGRAVYGTLTNRVAINKAVTVESINGAGATIIQGFQVPSNSTAYSNNVRCVYMTNNTVLNGFTISGGATLAILANGTSETELSGGGVYCESTNAILTNCVLSGNSCVCQGLTRAGGGAVYQGTLNNCTISNNMVSTNSLSYGVMGGGAFKSVLNNCLIISNSASFGGGAASSTLNNCSIIGNTAANYGSTLWGGGTYQCIANHCLIAENYCAFAGGGDCLGSLTYCVLSNNSCGSLISPGEGGGSYQGSLNNCLIVSNSAFGIGGNGGGVYLNTKTQALINCMIIGNTATNDGGGVFQGVITNCVIAGNSAKFGGGTYQSIPDNCTIVSNSASSAGGGLYAAAYPNMMHNCIIYYNSAPSGANYTPMGMNFCCTTPTLNGDLTSFTNSPLFKDSEAGDFHLQSNSPCINAGNNSYVSTISDLDGNPRIVGGTVDIGAYEYQTPSSVLSYAWAQQYGLPTDGSADYADSDGDGMNNYAEWKAGTNPTNAASVLKLASPLNSVSGITVTWQSVSGITYYMQSSTNFPTFTAIANNLVGQAGTTSYTDTTATNGGPYFYRVGVQ